MGQGARARQGRAARQHGSSALENRCAGRGKAGQGGAGYSAARSPCSAPWQKVGSAGGARYVAFNWFLQTSTEKQQQVGWLATTATQIGAEPARSKEHGRKEHGKAGQQGAKARQGRATEQLGSSMAARSVPLATLLEPRCSSAARSPSSTTWQKCGIADAAR